MASMARLRLPPLERSAQKYETNLPFYHIRVARLRLRGKEQL